jgi:hypothetical protein
MERARHRGSMVVVEGTIQTSSDENSYPILSRPMKSTEAD